MTTTLRGQNLRIMRGSSVLAVGETNCTITLNTNLQDVSTKDDANLANKQAVMSKSWQIQIESMEVLDVAYILKSIQIGTPFQLGWSEEPPQSSGTSGSSAEWARSGTAYLTDVTFSWNNREFSAKNMTFTGSGPISKN